MKTGHRICTAATPASLLPEAVTLKHKAPIKVRGNRGSKTKCVTELWDQNLPSDLLQEILSHLGIKANIRASAVCKTWCEAAVSVRKLLQPPLPWLLYPQKGSHDGNYILFDPSRSQTYEKSFPELKGREFSCSRDGWLLVLPNYSSDLKVFLFNPFTRKRVYLPQRPRFSFGDTLAFSAAPTSSSCLVISFNEYDCGKYFLIASWRPGETVWRTHRFQNQSSSTGRWARCVFSNDVFYFLSACCFLSVFDPSRETWNILPVKPWTCPTFCQIQFSSRVSMMEHEGDVFVLHMRRNNILALFKLNLKRMEWEEKREVGRLTIFASSNGSFARVGISAEERNRMCPSTKWGRSLCHLLGDEESYCLPTDTDFSKFLAWVDPAHNNVNL